MDRRDFLKTAGTGSVLATVTGSAPGGPPIGGPAGDRALWIATLRRIADPVLTTLANGTLKARMPVGQAPGADRRSVSHLEAIGRLIAGIAPWIELDSTGDPAEARLRAHYADLARRGIGRA